MSTLYRYDSEVDGYLDFSSWAAFTASALEVCCLPCSSRELAGRCPQACVGVRLGVRPDRGWGQGAPALKLKLNTPLMPTLQVTKLNAISILSGLAVVLVNWLVTVAVRKVR